MFQVIIRKDLMDKSLEASAAMANLSEAISLNQFVVEG